MAMKIIMAVCYLPCLLMMFGFLYMEGKQKGNVLLGVTLWPGAAEEPEVIAVKKRFRKEMQLMLFFSILLFALTCIPGRDSVFISLQLLWLVFVIVIFFFPVAWGNRRMKTLKRERNAAAGYKVNVDLKAAAQPKNRPFLKLSLAGMLCALIPVIAEIFLAPDSFYGWWTEGFLVTMFLVGVLCFGIQYYFWHLKTDVISYRSEVNIQLARVRQYQWSRFFCIMIWCNTLSTVMMWYGMHQPEYAFLTIFGGMICYMLITVLAAVIAEYNVRKAYGMYTEEPALQPEEDDYWLCGMFYYNKNDNRFMVNKRVGMGTTVNLAKTSGKIFCVGFSLLTVALLIWAAGMVLFEDFAPITLKVADNAVIASQYHQEYRIPLEEVETVELVEELPGMSKRVGSAMDSMMKGSFLDEDYQSCKVCVRRQKPPFLKIVAEDGMIYYFNDEDTKVTEQVYREIGK